MYSTISGDAPSQFSSTSQNLLALQQEAKQKRKCRRAGVIIIIIINFNFATFTYVFIFSLMLNYFVINDFNHILNKQLFKYRTILVMRALP